MKVMIKKPGEKPEVTTIENDLKSTQNVVGGMIEVVPIGKDGLLMIVNEEGLLLGLPHNFGPYVGTVFFCNANDEGDFTGITEEQISHLTLFFGGIKK